MRSFLLLLTLWAATLPALSADFASQTVLCTYKLFHPASTGTCVIFSKPGEATDTHQYLLVTAAHVLEGMPSDDATLVLRRSLPDATYQRVDTRIFVRHGGSPLWTRHSHEDVAVLPLQLPDDAPVFALDPNTLATEAGLKKLNIHVGSTLFSAVYPERREANLEGFPIVRQCTVASFPFFPVNAHKTFLMDAFAFHGDSGGPVFVRDDRNGSQTDENPPLIVGLVLAMWHTDEKTETPSESREVRTPLGLATTVHAQAIRETLDLLK